MNTPDQTREIDLAEWDLMGWIHLGTLAPTDGRLRVCGVDVEWYVEDIEANVFVTEREFTINAGVAMPLGAHTLPAEFVGMPTEAHVIAGVDLNRVVAHGGIYLRRFTCGCPAQIVASRGDRYAWESETGEVG
ncbi:MAG: hypothetical protein H6525_07425 [Actinobacteria bacterium]|nr:hypothetical protein [Actinomycetota bacterium]MCB9412659.1 hypothetical protein [Actinomycetota bacterium]